MARRPWNTSGLAPRDARAIRKAETPPRPRGAAPARANAEMTRSRVPRREDCGSTVLIKNVEE